MMNFSPRLGLTLAALAALGIAAVQPAAANSIITFTAPQNITGATDVLTNGTLVGAYAFANDKSQNPTVRNNPVVNGVIFAGVGGGQVGDGTQSNGSLYVSTFNQEAPGAFGSISPAYSTLSSSYQTLLGSGLYHDSPGATDKANFILGATNFVGAPTSQGTLIAGHTYETQFFVNDSRGANGPGNTETITDGTDSNAGSGSRTLTFNTASAEGGLGQFVVGTFVADSSGLASFTLQGNNSTQANAFQYRDLGVAAAPEPSQVAGLGFAAFGLAGLLLKARKRSAAAA